MDTPSRTKSPHSPAHRFLVRVWIAAAIALMACTPTPLGPIATSARTHFSESRTCPLHRVASRIVDTTPRPPDPVARDPERLVMWRRAAASRAPERRLVHVRGCDEETTYACWDVGGYVPGRRGHKRRWVSIGAACLEPDQEIGER